MIEYIEGNIFNSPTQTIVNTVNTVGVMGKGLALSFKKRYPQMFESYRTACEKHQLTIGKLMLFYAADHWVLMFPTKENWRNPSKVEYIEEGLKKFVCTYAEKGITSIAFPRLGCGNGELSWDIVRPVMEKYLKPLPITVYIYLGAGNTYTPEHLAQEETIEWLRKNARDMSFDGLCDDIKYECAIMPYVVSFHGREYSLVWDNGLKFSYEGAYEIVYNEDELFALWDKIRRHGIVEETGNSVSIDLVFAFLNQKGYLSQINIVDDRTGERKRGYQINAGLGRLFSARGEKE